MRGNPVLAPGYSDVAGSIPAYAGEPQACLPLLDDVEVYPRVCGGTDQGVDGRQC